MHAYTQTVNSALMYLKYLAAFGVFLYTAFHNSTNLSAYAITLTKYNDSYSKLGHLTLRTLTAMHHRM